MALITIIIMMMVGMKIYTLRSILFNHKDDINSDF